MPNPNHPQRAMPWPDLAALPRCRAQSFSGSNTTSRKRRRLGQRPPLGQAHLEVLYSLGFWAVLGYLRPGARLRQGRQPLARRHPRPPAEAAKAGPPRAQRPIPATRTPMSLLTPAQRAQLLANGKANAARNAAGQAEHDFVPVVKLFTPDAGATWLLTESIPATRTSPSAYATSASAARRSATSRWRNWRPCAASSAFRSNATALQGGQAAGSYADALAFHGATAT